jgi:hypothetical protein
MRQLGVVKSGVAFSAADMRTWPLSFVLIDAAIFALIFAVISASMGEGRYSAAVAGGISALVAMGFAPRLASRVLR